MLSHDESIGWFAMERLSAGVTRIWEHQIKREYGANIWLVKGRDRNLLVDSRFGLASLRENIPELNAKPIIVIATHSHCDHIGGLHEFANCRIHEAEANIVCNPTVENTVAKGYMTDAMFEGAPPKFFKPESVSSRQTLLCWATKTSLISATVSSRCCTSRAIHPVLLDYSSRPPAFCFRVTLFTTAATASDVFTSIIPIWMTRRPRRPWSA
jgi:Metallo-beta-lactamase superfamily